MATKRKARAITASERKLAATVRRSAREIWYAGLGVFSTTRDEGSKVYKALVAEGRRVEAEARKLASAQKRALATWGSVEKNLKKRVGAVKAKVKKLRTARKRPAVRRTRSVKK